MGVPHNPHHSEGQLLGFSDREMWSALRYPATTTTERCLQTILGEVVTKDELEMMAGFPEAAARCSMLIPRGRREIRRR